MICSRTRGIRTLANEGIARSRYLFAPGKTSHSSSKPSFCVCAMTSNSSYFSPLVSAICFHFLHIRASSRSFSESRNASNFCSYSLSFSSLCFFISSVIFASFSRSASNSLARTLTFLRPTYCFNSKVRSSFMRSIFSRSCFSFSKSRMRSFKRRVIAFFSRESVKVPTSSCVPFFCF